jgi:hypothetical protein
MSLWRQVFRSFESCKNSYDNDIKIDLNEREYEVVEDASASAYGPVAGSCEDGDEPPGSIKGRKRL